MVYVSDVYMLPTAWSSKTYFNKMLSLIRITMTQFCLFPSICNVLLNLNLVWCQSDHQLWHNRSNYEGTGPKQQKMRKHWGITTEILFVILTKKFSNTSTSWITTLISRFMEKTWGRSGADRTRGTIIYWNSHNIVNTAWIYFKFDKINIGNMSNSKPMK